MPVNEAPVSTDEVKHPEDDQESLDGDGRRNSDSSGTSGNGQIPSTPRIPTSKINETGDGGASPSSSSNSGWSPQAPIAKKREQRPPPPLPPKKEKPRFDLVPIDKQRKPQHKALKANIFDSHCHLDRLYSRMYPPSSHEFYEKVPHVLRDGKMPLQNLRNYLGAEHSAKFEGLIHVICDPRDFQVGNKINFRFFQDKVLHFLSSLANGFGLLVRNPSG